MIPLTQRLVSKNFQQRLVWIRIVFILIIGVVIIRAVQLQIVDNDRYTKIANKQHDKSVAIKLRRGPIYDAGGNILAVSLPLQSIFAIPQEIENAASAASLLAEPLNIPKSQLEKKLNSNISFTWLKRNTKPQVSETIQRMGLPGIHFIREYQRYYPMGKHAAHVLGFSGVDSKGLEGIENKFNSHLMGRTNTAKTWDYFSSDSQLKPLSGGSLHLTIHSKIQFYTEKELKKAVWATEAQNAIAIIMDSNSGAILSMASYPDYDPNNFDRYHVSRYFNRAVNATYEPGSTFKIITVSTALDHGIVKKGSIFDCQQGEYQIQDRVIHDVSKYGWLPLEKIIQKSSNICVAKIGQRIPKPVFYKSIREFGFGSETGIELPGASNVKGKVHNYQNWSDTDVATMSFGHTISATPIQVITAINSIATGGILVKPSIIKAAHKEDGTKIQLKKSEAKRILKPETADIMRTFMESVTQPGGTGYLASIEGLTVAGKTGTTRKFDIRKREYSRTNHISSFIGFFPSGRPELTILVIIDEPQKEYLGSKGAAPIFKKIALHAQRFYPETKIPTPGKHGAQNMKNRLFQSAASKESSLESINDISLALKGLTMREALDLADRADLDVTVKGAGIVRQVIPNGLSEKSYTLVLK